jgi:hypothetical protein
VKVGPSHEWLCLDVDEVVKGQSEEVKANVLKDFDGEYGDRRQEIVLVGLGLDAAALKKGLDQCLVTEKEFKGGPEKWAEFEDPFELEWGSQ